MSMTDRAAILIDGEWFKKVLQDRDSCKQIPAAFDISKALNPLFRDNRWPEMLRLYRIFYYTAPPYSKLVVNPLNGETTSYAQTPEFMQNESLIADLKLKSNFAVRLGELANRGWKLKHRIVSKPLQKGVQRHISASDIRPNLVQKGIDVMMAIDMVTLALKRLVGVVVIITGDGDLVPALKLARVEGLRVILVKPKGNVVIAKELFTHSDLVVEI